MQRVLIAVFIAFVALGIHGFSSRNAETAVPETAPEHTPAAPAETINEPPAASPLAPGAIDNDDDDDPEDEDDRGRNRGRGSD